MAGPQWTHTTPLAIAVWLQILIPFTVWDSAYVFLRPYSLPGGLWHWPLFAPYAHYATIDRMYSRAGWESGDAFVAAHCVLNLAECALATGYLFMAKRYGARRESGGGWGRTVLSGRPARWAVVLGLVQGAMTAAKTVLCLLYEAFGGWRNVGHNDWVTLLTGWIVTVWV
ncbi:hypothetical protein GJ744_006565 [Endocarpon pusillum]|uniref:Uncharacterized protein n=1 Tax=Endocarpon pusillum TaxID=364733 RepID=A0A8H7AVW8_9EURO|nr:hypothetical protein GJ744_006565 [Endocarpon pusillum]